MLTVSRYINDTAARFEHADLCFGHGTDNALDEAYFLVMATLGIPFDEGGEAQLAEELDLESKRRLDALVKRRIEERVPVAYLVGQAWFAGHRFLSDSRALVPRSPIAELINNEFAGLISQSPRRVLDLCCGGGCIGLAIALQYRDCEVVLSDISAPALALAEENSRLHGFSREGRVSLVNSDLFHKVQGCFDLIVSNPPYVGLAEWQSLPDEYRTEPDSGLISEEDGLAIPLAILREAGSHLNEGGLLIMEVGFSAEALMARCPRVEFLWLEFEAGGSGVFALSHEQLRDFEAV